MVSYQSPAITVSLCGVEGDALSRERRLRRNGGPQPSKSTTPLQTSLEMCLLVQTVANYNSVDK